MFRTIILSFLILTFAYNANASAAYNPEVLSKILFEVSQQDYPVVLFDIDDTLTDTRGRTLTILNELAQEESTYTSYPEETAKLKRLTLPSIPYEIGDVFKILEIKNPSFIEAASKAWVTRFYSNAYVRIDSEITGAAKYLKALHDAGAYIVYLTGRDEPRMLQGTLQGILKNNFPYDGLTKLILKPNKEMPDLEFKKSAFKQISILGHVVGVFENEPANLNAMHAYFPEAQAVFLDTLHSKKPDVPKAGIPWIKNYE